MNRKARNPARSRCRDTSRKRLGEGRKDGQGGRTETRQIGSIPGIPHPSRIEKGHSHFRAHW